MARTYQMIGAVEDRRGFGIGSSEVSVKDDQVQICHGGVCRQLTIDGAQRLISLLSNAIATAQLNRKEPTE